MMKPYCANIEITKKCNYDCIHCFNGGNFEAEMDLRKFEVIINKLQKEKIFWYVLTGGEPLIHRNWKAMVSYLNDKNLCYGISTNGSLLDEEKIEYLKEKRVKNVLLSLDGPEKIHNQIRRNRNAFNSISTCSKLLIRHNIPFSFLMIVMSSNCKYIEETCRTAKDLGAPAIRINFFKDFCSKNKEYPKVLKGKELEDAVSCIEHAKIKYKEKIKVNFENSLAHFFKTKEPCGAGESKIQVDVNGNVSPCRYLRFNMGNLANEELSTILIHPIIGEIRQFHKSIKDGCISCLSNHICRGGCPAFVYNEYGNLLKRDSRCWIN